MTAIPVSLLLDSRLTAAAKVLWLTLRHQGAGTGPTALMACTGLTRVTIRKGMAQLQANGWLPVSEAQGTAGGALVSVPGGIIYDRRVSPRAKLLYALLQTLPAFQPPSGQLTYATLGAHAQHSVNTIRKAIANLVSTEWLEVMQVNQKAPLRFTLCNPDLVRQNREVAAADYRLQQVEYKNEQIMKEYLSLLIDSDNFMDNARPAFLPNLETDQRLELDRYYPHTVAFEYQGMQHFRTTAKFPSERALSKRQVRDAVKRVLCEQRGITLVTITRNDLSLSGMQRKVGNLLPRRDLRGHEELIEYLERLKK
jgi:hypothetical protein